jgi:hypothetical protein
LRQRLSRRRRSVMIGADRNESSGGGPTP